MMAVFSRQYIHTCCRPQFFWPRIRECNIERDNKIELSNDSHNDKLYIKLCFKFKKVLITEKYKISMSFYKFVTLKSLLAYERNRILEKNKLL